MTSYFFLASSPSPHKPSSPQHYYCPLLMLFLYRIMALDTWRKTKKTGKMTMYTFYSPSPLLKGPVILSIENNLIRSIRAFGSSFGKAEGCPSLRILRLLGIIPGEFLGMVVKSIGTSVKPGTHLKSAVTLPLSNFINPDLSVKYG